MPVITTVKPLKEDRQLVNLKLGSRSMLTRMRKHLTTCENGPEKIQDAYRKLLQRSGETSSGKVYLKNPM